MKVHGYLDKEKPEDKRKYYELLSNARLFVNTTPGWSGFQALMEAMYFHNPIVVRPNESLSSYFPNLKELAYILEEGGASLVALLLRSFSDGARYQSMSKVSRQSVEASTWSNFTDGVIKLFK